METMMSDRNEILMSQEMLTPQQTATLGSFSRENKYIVIILLLSVNQHKYQF